MGLPLYGSYLRLSRRDRASHPITRHNPSAARLPAAADRFDHLHTSTFLARGGSLLFFFPPSLAPPNPVGVSLLRIASRCVVWVALVYYTRTRVLLPFSATSCRWRREGEKRLISVTYTHNPGAHVRNTARQHDKWSDGTQSPTQDPGQITDPEEPFLDYPDSSVGLGGSGDNIGASGHWVVWSGSTAFEKYS